MGLAFRAEPENRKAVDLGSVPGAEWDASPGLVSMLFGSWGFGSEVLRGLRSPIRTRTWLPISGARYRTFKPEDNVGSPYCIRRYVVDAHLGGAEGLAIARQRASQARNEAAAGFRAQPCSARSPVGRRTPPSISSRERRGCKKDPASYIEIQGKFYACGRDPNFPAWPDVLQLNAFGPGLRQAAIETVSVLRRSATEFVVTWPC